MSLGVIAGFMLAYPFNVWMFAKGLNHGLMTERPGPRGSEEQGKATGKQRASSLSDFRFSKS